MDELLEYVFFEILGNLFFRIGRTTLCIVTFGSVRLEDPTRSQTFVVVLVGLFVGLFATWFLLHLV